MVSIRWVDRFPNVRQSPAAPPRITKATSIRRTGKFYSSERDRVVVCARSIMRAFYSLRRVMARGAGTPAN